MAAPSWLGGSTGLSIEPKHARLHYTKMNGMAVCTVIDSLEHTYVIDHTVILFVFNYSLQIRKPSMSDSLLSMSLLSMSEITRYISGLIASLLALPACTGSTFFALVASSQASWDAALVANSTAVTTMCTQVLRIVSYLMNSQAQSVQPATTWRGGTAGLVLDAYAIQQLEQNHCQLEGFRVFRLLAKGEPIPEGYTQIPYHIVFDVKFDLRYKARLVADGNWTELVREDIYSGVVGMNSVRLGFTLGDLNNLKCIAREMWEMHT